MDLDISNGWFATLQKLELSICYSKSLLNKFKCHKSAGKTKDIHTITNLTPKAYSGTNQRSKTVFFFGGEIINSF